MKRLFIMIFAVAFVLPMFAQQPAAQKGQNLAIKVLVEEMVEPFPATAKLQMENKLNRLLTQNGIASMDYLGQFFITAHAAPLTKDILPGPPTKIAETMEFTFYIADYYNQIIFSTASVNAKGVGETESKSYMNAIKNLNLNSPALKQFVAEGRAKIIDYYNQQADKMIMKAKNLAKQKSFEEALWIVSTIPSECDKYETALAAGLEIYQEYIDYTCQVNLAAAKTAWMSGQNSLAAMDAGEYLSQIYPDAACYPEAEELYKEIKGKVLDDWKFEMKKYDDSVDLEFARIGAMRDVGVAYGTHQQPTSTNIGFLR
ncbi:MAG: hypothetical protein IJ776_07825 [Paludibacteraceae bacterium]|nr:hypothetical protein [Paludibacteraceae bacterium]